MTTAPQQTARSRRGIGIPVFGVLLLTSGIIALLNTLDVLSWSVWLDMWRLWPVLLVLWGLNIIFHRFSPLIVLGIAAIVVAIGVGFAFAVDDGEVLAADLVDFERSAQLGDADRIDLDIGFGAGKLTVGTLDASDSRAVLIQFRDAEDYVDFSSSTSGGTLRVKADTDESGFSIFRRDVNGREWTVLLRPDVAATLNIDGGAGDFNIDLENTLVYDFDINVGASSLDVIAPAAGDVDGSIGAGVASINVTVPDGVAARINNESGVSSVDIDPDRFPKTGDVHESPGFATATNRLDLHIGAGASSIKVK